jgi:hypothetical protein
MFNQEKQRTKTKFGKTNSRNVKEKNTVEKWDLKKIVYFPVPS